mgnify:CR=1 FL=1
MTTASTSSFSAPLNAWLVDGVRTPMVDYCGPLGHVSPTDMGIKVARAVLERSGVPAADVGSVITGSMAQADFDAFVLPRHIGLYAGVPQAVPAILVQRICGTGFELFRQAADQIALGYTDVALVVGTESMTRNPIAAYTHRTGFKLGAPVEFKDFLMEALIDTAGLRDSDDEVERIGIARAWEAITAADAVVFLHDLTRCSASDYIAADADIAATIAQKLPQKVPIIHVWNKADAQPLASSDEGLVLSAKTGAGLDTLRSRLLEAAGWQPAQGGTFIARQRHLHALKEVADHLAHASDLLANGSNALDLLAEELRLGQNALNRITGEFGADDLLGVIFSKFCIGK